MRSGRRIAIFAVAVLVYCSAGVSAVDPGPLVISEFRLRGPSGLNDEFVEIYNPGDSAHVVAGGGTGYALAASNGVARFIIPNNTVIPARGHYLGVNSIAYSLGSYPAGNGTTTTGNVTYTADIPDNAGIALFNTSNPADFTLANRLDAVGSTAETNVIYKEGAGYAALSPAAVQYSWFRTMCPVMLSCSGQPQDTGSNAADFLFTDTSGTSTAAGQRLGAPGPENSTSPIRLVPSGAPSLAVSLLDPGVDALAPPNHVRDYTSDPANDSIFGTIAIRRTVTNNSAEAITRLRFRVIDITTFFVASGTADLRLRTSGVSTVGLSTGGTATVQGTTLETPPSQLNGGGFNSTLSAGTVTLATPLAAGATLNVQFLFGIQQTGNFRVSVVLESLPAASSSVVSVSGHTEVVAAITAQFLISEFRVRGPSGANDEFVEIYNNTDVNLTVWAFDGSAGYGLFASDGAMRFLIPNGTVIPGRGHFLGVNSLGYSLGSYPAGNGTTATGDATYTTDIPDNAGLALFRTANPANLFLTNRLDAVGSTSVANTLYKEGTGYPALAVLLIDSSFSRKVATSGGAEGLPQDTNNNAADFLFVDTAGNEAGAGQRLGAPGPENLSGPTTDGSALTHARLDPNQFDNLPPNAVRDFTSDPGNDSTFGTLSIRRTFTNNTGADITRLRFRVIDLTTFLATSGVTDLRPRTSGSAVVTLSDSSMVTVQGTTLEEPPSQPSSGGFNSTMSANSVSAATPLANGASIRVQFLLGLQQDGCYRFAVVAESLPAGASRDVFAVAGPIQPATGVVATAITPSSVGLSWNPVTCAQSYEVFRSANGTSYSFVGSSVMTSFTDTTAAANTAYLYVVRSIDAAGSPSIFSSHDLATTVIFTDPVLTPGTPVKAVHITQLRTAVNAVRALSGLGAAPFTTDPAITVGSTMVRADHIAQLRAAVDPARTALVLANPAYTDPTVTALATLVKAAHINDLRNRVQ